MGVDPVSKNATVAKKSLRGQNPGPGRSPFIYQAQSGFEGKERGLGGRKVPRAGGADKGKTGNQMCQKWLRYWVS